MLYVCATPIGNMQDISLRALEVLNNVDIVLCEDTRNSQKLLNYHGIKAKKLVSLHEHNELNMTEKVLTWLQEDYKLVLISDAGTPGISDPGARLCNVILENGYVAQPIPGACAYISLLSVSGILYNQHLFVGFLPSKSTHRVRQLTNYIDADYPVIFYESPHRILACLKDIQEVYGINSQLVIGRELTKMFETIKRGRVADIIEFIMSDLNQQKGEFVVILLPKIKAKNSTFEFTKTQLDAIALLTLEFPPKKVAQLISNIFDVDKQLVYDFIINKNI